MINYLEKTGKTEDEAIAAALRELQMERDDVSVEIVERAKSGFLGIGAQPAKIRVSWETEDPVPTPAAAAVQPAEEKPAPAAKPAEKPAPEKKVNASAPEAPADEAADYTAVRSFLTGLLEHMGIEAEISMSERDGGGIAVTVPLSSVIGALSYRFLSNDKRSLQQ